jgi:HEPN domain-containing protein
MQNDRKIPGSPLEWLAYARRDLAMARVPLPEGGAYESLCFHAQQAAEKAIKAVYRSRGQSFRYTHDIDDLLDGLERLGIDVPEAVWEAADLTRFAWEVRYPGLGEPVSGQEYEQAVTLAEHAVEWATTLVERRA